MTGYYSQPLIVMIMMMMIMIMIMMMTRVQKTGDYSQPIVRKRPDEDKRQSEEEGAQAEGDFMSEAKVTSN